ncbi:hypothetical protein [Acetoanaerobium pronyense]|uniref:hypothetical protein n=1 Tax=Acetoanaerobium pronyense TaxID=1482736 RepID=UPI001AE7A51C|nr:hypothetical protein [Acetoanaerobium pronyense]
MCVYFLSLITPSFIGIFKFNLKYGFSLVELGYGFMVIIFIFILILRNNSVIIFNVNWEEFYSAVKEVLRRNKIQTFYVKPTLYVEGKETMIKMIYSVLNDNMILVKYSRVDELELDGVFLDEIRLELLKEKVKISQRARYTYFVGNLILTALLLANIGL